MKKHMNEAAVQIDISGLQSDDLETLSRMLALAGQAESSSVESSPMAPEAPMGLSSIDDVQTGSVQTPSIMDPLQTPTMDIGWDDSEDESSEVSLDLDGQPALELSSEIEEEPLAAIVGDDDISTELDSDFGDDLADETYDDTFDMDRMSSLAGIHESDDSADITINMDSADEVPDDSAGLDESLLPDLSLDEDSVASNSQEHGPFRTERECVEDGTIATNGVEGNNFIVVPKGNAFYWKRTVQEDTLNRPESEQYDDEGIRNSRHEYRHKRTALGDNPLLSNISEDTDDVDEELESVESIYESLNEKFKKFMGDK